MEVKPLNLNPDKKQSLEAWVTEIFLPVLSAIGFIANALEDLYQEIK